VCARSAGGNNAGHTVVADGVTHNFHILPSGLFSHLFSSLYALPFQQTDLEMT
jgi:adenylosuccinate synthase